MSNNENYNQMEQEVEENTIDRKLATIRKIDGLEPIEGADNIELARVGGWKVVVGKGLYNVGDKVVYFEIDSLLPFEPEFDFLKDSSIKELPDGTKGYRLKTIKLKGQVSQGLVLPLEDTINIIKRNLKNDVSQEIDERDDNEGLEKEMKENSHQVIDQFNIEAFTGPLEVGLDLTQNLNVRKYETDTNHGQGSGKKSKFPHFIPKTDEERIQNLENEIPKWVNREIPFYVTEKCHGSSSSFYLKDEYFGICSRNKEIGESDDSSLWQVAKKYNIKEKLESLGKNIAIQGELIGPKIQGNHYELNELQVKFFNAFDIDNQNYYNIESMINLFHNDLNLPMVPILNNKNVYLHDYVEEDLKSIYNDENEINHQMNKEIMDEILNFSDDKSKLNESKLREGIVFRSLDNTISFKAINSNFLLKTGN